MHRSSTDGIRNGSMARQQPSRRRSSAMLVVALSGALVACGNGPVPDLPGLPDAGPADATQPDARTCLFLAGTDPSDGARDVPPTTPGFEDFLLLYQVYAGPGLPDFDPDTVDTVQLMAPEGVVPLVWTVGMVNRSVVSGNVAGGLSPNSDYTLYFPAGEDGLRDQISGFVFCEEIRVEFSTGAAN